MTYDSTYYDEGYFIHGTSTGKSNYNNYRWLADLTVPMARSLIEFIGMRHGDTVLDVGCGMGHYVKAMRTLGIEAFGYDISEWAISNCHRDVVGYVSTTMHRTNRYTHIFSKDCCEHIPKLQLQQLLTDLGRMFRSTMLFIVPLTRQVDGPYLRSEDNSDPSHVIRWPLDMWVDFVNACVGASDVAVMGSWHVPALKPASFTVPRSCGFILVKRL